MLWGVRTNRTIRGVLHLGTLAVSLPGTVELKFTIKTTTTTTVKPTTTGAQRDRAKDDTTTTTTTATTALGLLYMYVHADPLAPGFGQGSAAACVFVFKEAVCPVYSHTSHTSTSHGSTTTRRSHPTSLSLVTGAEEADWLSDFPMVRGFRPAITVAATTTAVHSQQHSSYRLYLSLSCADTLTNAWAVDTQVGGGLPHTQTYIYWQTASTDDLSIPFHPHSHSHHLFPHQILIFFVITFDPGTACLRCFPLVWACGCGTGRGWIPSGRGSDCPPRR